jgi:hypothetical protein
MNGFEIKTTETTLSLAENGSFPDLSAVDIDRAIARARSLRSAEIARMGRRFAQTWASLWRRPGRLAVRPSH